MVRQHVAMSDSLIDAVVQDGHLTTVTRLLAAGHSLRTINGAVNRGEIFRLCRGWVATWFASQAAVVAVAHRGRLTGATALASIGVWDAADRDIHVRLAPNSPGSIARLRVPIEGFVAPRFVATGFRRHWTTLNHDQAVCPPWRVSVLDALAQVARTASAAHFLACIESALHTKRMSPAQLPVLFDSIPRSFADLQGLIDQGAQSGIESLCRYGVIPFARSVQTQVSIDGIGKFGGRGQVDLLLDGWLVIELDGDEHHDPIADRARDALLTLLGYRVHRFGYDQIVHHWATVEATIRELLAVPPVGIAIRPR
jgi:hypothetical protein